MRQRLELLSIGTLVVAIGLSAFGVAANADVAPRRGAAKPTPVAPRGWSQTVERLHRPKPGVVAPLDASGRPMLVLHAMAIDETATLRAHSDTGGFSAADLAAATHVLRDPASHEEMPAESRTLDIIYQIQRHFDAQEIRVVSGYRKPRPGNGQGNHGKGRAIDFMVPGSSDRDVADYAHGHGFAGVGYYPISGFVHVDVRAKSYFWCDRSRPGGSSRERGILLDIASAADQNALARGEGPPPPFGTDGGVALPDNDDDE